VYIQAAYKKPAKRKAYEKEKQEKPPFNRMRGVGMISDCRLTIGELRLHQPKDAYIQSAYRKPAKRDAYKEKRKKPPMNRMCGVGDTAPISLHPQDTLMKILRSRKPGSN
jgi:hypothetical protein